LHPSGLHWSDTLLPTPVPRQAIMYAIHKVMTDTSNALE
jgi:hypothetical protein